MMDASKELDEDEAALYEEPSKELDEDEMPDIEDTEEEENADGYDYDELPDF